MSGVNAMIRAVTEKIGYRESGTNFTPFNQWMGRIPGYAHDGYGYPWCHSFLSWALHASGNAHAGPKTAGCATGVAWFKARKRFYQSPQVGDFVYYGPSGEVHVELVVAVNGSSIVTIGGNTSGNLAGAFHNGDGVYRKTVTRSNPRIHGYGRPDYGPEGDDMPTAKEVADAVYERFTHEVTSEVWAAREGLLAAGQRIDPRTALRQLWAYAKDGYMRDREILARVEAQTATIRALAEALAAQGGQVDVEDLIGRIEQAIAKVTIRLDVADDAK